MRRSFFQIAYAFSSLDFGRNFFSEIERKRAANPESTAMEESIARLGKEAKKEMEEEVRSGICGKVLGEDELTGTPNKKRTPPVAGDKPGKQQREDSQTRPRSSKPSFGPGAFGLGKARVTRAASCHSSFDLRLTNFLPASPLDPTK